VGILILFHHPVRTPENPPEAFCEIGRSIFRENVSLFGSRALACSEVRDVNVARILIVDDDKTLLLTMSEYLSAYGFESELAYSAAQARHYLEHSACDAIVSDFNMPCESGLDLLRHVSTRYPGLPFIMMTGSSTSLLKDAAMKMGSSGYVVKPFRFRDLVGTLETVLGFSNRGEQALAATA